MQNTDQLASERMKLLLRQAGLILEIGKALEKYAERLREAKMVSGVPKRESILRKPDLT